MSSMKEKAFELVEKLFEKKLDKGGSPYINHLIKVASKVKCEKEKTIALLHDVIEDTDVSAEDLINLGFPKDIVDSVVIVTRKDDETYSDFIERIANSNDLSAIRVKVADLEDNMDLSRIANHSEDDIKRVEKRYKPAYALLNDKLKAINNK